ncbi:hypothetical protein Sango_1026800 [Sesamum angolense]|uniref:Uncharacterized protein n=1 Tax=Sesamum angolense TaxID=2727404 RepID=A0AAE2BYX4_9LAMI|nr:hypothetical protein Sango_1026800 [Sesamum angolense]
MEDAQAAKKESHGEKRKDTKEKAPPRNLGPILGTESLRKSRDTTRIGSQMENTVREKIIQCLRRNLDIFASTPQDLEVIDPNMITHHLNIDPGVKPVKQKKRHFGDLNKACPKAFYPLHKIDQLVDSTFGCELLSMMDAPQGYYQIMLAPEDRRRVSFITSAEVKMNMPLKQTLEKLDTYGRLVKWAVELSEYDILYMSRTTMKAQALADFVSEMAGTPMEDTSKVEKWLLHVDRSSTT